MQWSELRSPLCPPVAHCQALWDALSEVKRELDTIAVMKLRAAQGPQIVDSPDFFPDPWRNTHADFERLLWRLFYYLNWVPQRLDIHSEEKLPLHRYTWIEAASSEVISIKLSHDLPNSPRAILGIALRTAVEALLIVHQKLEAPSAQASPQTLQARGQRVEFASLLLGLGPAALSSAEIKVERQKSLKIGVISPLEHAFLLGLWFAWRGTPKKDVKWVVQSLSGNPAHLLQQSYRWAQPQQRELQHILGDPHLSGYVAIPIPAQLHAAPQDVTSEVLGESHKAQRNQGQPVFRIERHLTWKLAKAFGFSSFVLAGVLGRLPGVEWEQSWSILAALGLTVFGAILGRLRFERICSDPSCAEDLAPELTLCPGCGGTIAGVITHPKQRMQAEERWRAAHAESSRQSVEQMP